jgi:hypothetical protein
VDLTNAGGIRGVQATLVDVPEELTLTSVECTTRTAGFACDANEGANGLELVVVDLNGGCLAAGTGPIARVCVSDTAPMCTAPSTIALDPQSVLVASCANTPVSTCNQPGGVLCGGELGDCQADGDFDLFDVINTIDAVLGRITLTTTQSTLCDNTCDGTVDIFDVVAQIDALLQGIPTPQSCPGATVGQSAQAALQRAAVSSRQGARAATRVETRARGRLVQLDNPKTAVRALELTLVPEGGPFDVRDVRPARRDRKFEVAFHQADPFSPVKVVVVSLDGEAITPGSGPVVRLRPESGTRRGHLRLTDVKIVDR